jgi:hypothetical protein
MPLIENASSFQEHLFNLARLGLMSMQPQAMQIAADLVAVAAEDSLLATRRAELVGDTEEAIRKSMDRGTSIGWLESVVAPLVHAGLLPPGHNVFEPKEIIDETKRRGWGVAKSEIPAERSKMAGFVAERMRAWFTQGIIYVPRFEYLMDPEAFVVGALANRKDVPLSCVVPTVRTLLLLAHRDVAHTISRNAGLSVEMDYSGIPKPEAEQRLPVTAPVRAS